MAKLFVAAIAIGTFYANPAWGAEGLPRGADGNPLSDRWIQPGESFWFNLDHWVHIYQAYARLVPGAPTLSVDLPSPEKLEPAPAEAPAATESVAIVDQADQAEAPPAPAEAPAPAPAPKKKPKAAATPKAAAAPPADPEPAPAPTPAQEAPPAPEAPTVAPDAPQE